MPVCIQVYECKKIKRRRARFASLYLGFLNWISRSFSQ